MQSVEPSQPCRALQSRGRQVGKEPSACIVFTYLLITNVEKDPINNKRENKAQLHRHKSELQFSSNEPEHEMDENIYWCIFIFPLSVFHCSKVTGLCPPLNEAAAARLS